MKAIPNYQKYSISKCGKVYSHYTNKYLSPALNRDGYLQVSLFKDGKGNSKLVHRLVAITYLDFNPSSKDVVIDHIDNDRLNNNVYNLQVITQRLNSSKDKTGGTSVFTGVTWHKKASKWQASIRIGKKRIHLGLFSCELKAARKYTEALAAIKNK